MINHIKTNQLSPKTKIQIQKCASSTFAKVQKNSNHMSKDKFDFFYMFSLQFAVFFWCYLQMKPTTGKFDMMSHIPITNK